MRLSVTVLNCVGYCAMEFLLISSFVSPSPPPVAASGLVLLSAFVISVIALVYVHILVFQIQ